MATPSIKATATAASIATRPLVRDYVSKSKVGVVVSAGKMSKAVKVRIAGQEWNKKFRKFFPSAKTYLVSDPNSSLLEGDVVRISSGHRVSPQIRHVVTAIVAPYGTPANERPPVMNDEERKAERIKQRLLKDVRSAQRGRVASIMRLKQAETEGYEIPDLETAMRNVRLREAEEAKRKGDGAEKHEGQAKQMISKKEQRRLERQKAKGERRAGEKVKEAKLQTDVE